MKVELIFTNKKIHEIQITFIEFKSNVEKQENCTYKATQTTSLFSHFEELFVKVIPPHVKII